MGPGALVTPETRLWDGPWHHGKLMNVEEVLRGEQEGLQQQSRRPAKKRGCWKEVPLGRWATGLRAGALHVPHAVIPGKHLQALRIVFFGTPTTIIVIGTTGGGFTVCRALQYVLYVGSWL